MKRYSDCLFKIVSHPSVLIMPWVFRSLCNIWGHPLNTYVKSSEKLTFQTPWYAHVRVRIRGLEMLVFGKILRTYLWILGSNQWEAEINGVLCFNTLQPSATLNAEMEETALHQIHVNVKMALKESFVN